MEVEMFEEAAISINSCLIQCSIAALKPFYTHQPDPRTRGMPIFYYGTPLGTLHPRAVSVACMFFGVAPITNTLWPHQIRSKHSPVRMETVKLYMPIMPTHPTPRNISQPSLLIPNSWMKGTGMERRAYC